jgi:hypothetical protein
MRKGAVAVVVELSNPFPTGTGPVGLLSVL